MLAQNLYRQPPIHQKMVIDRAQIHVLSVGKRSCAALALRG